MLVVLAVQYFRLYLKASRRVKLGQVKSALCTTVAASTTLPTASARAVRTRARAFDPGIKSSFAHPLTTRPASAAAAATEWPGHRTRWRLGLLIRRQPRAEAPKVNCDIEALVLVMLVHLRDLELKLCHHPRGHAPCSGGLGDIGASTRLIEGVDRAVSGTHREPSAQEAHVDTVGMRLCAERWIHEHEIKGATPDWNQFLGANLCIRILGQGTSACNGDGGGGLGSGEQGGVSGRGGGSKGGNAGGGI